MSESGWVRMKSPWELLLVKHCYAYQHGQSLVLISFPFILGWTNSASKELFVGFVARPSLLPSTHLSLRCVFIWVAPFIWIYRHLPRDFRKPPKEHCMYSWILTTVRAFKSCIWMLETNPLRQLRIELENNPKRGNDNEKIIDSKSCLDNSKKKHAFVC
jgi:hypothetical protein